MGSKNDLLKNSWITLAAAFAVLVVLALSGRANAADIEPTVAYVSIASVTR